MRADLGDPEAVPPQVDLQVIPVPDDALAGKGKLPYLRLVPILVPSGQRDMAPAPQPELQLRSDLLVQAFGDGNVLCYWYVGSQLAGPQPAHANVAVEYLVHPEEGPAAGVHGSRRQDGVVIDDALHRADLLVLLSQDEEVVADGAQETLIRSEFLQLDPVLPSPVRHADEDPALDPARHGVFCHDLQLDARGPLHVSHELFGRVGRGARGVPRGHNHRRGFAVAHHGDVRDGGTGRQQCGEDRQSRDGLLPNREHHASPLRCGFLYCTCSEPFRRMGRPPLTATTRRRTA